MSWKKAVYEYVRDKNEWEADGWSLFDTLDHIDEQSKLLQQKRYTNMQRMYRARKLTPINNQTRLKVMHVAEQEGYKVVDVLLQRLFKYEIGQVEHREERMEYEKLWLQERRNHWHILRIEPDESEGKEGFLHVQQSMERPDYDLTSNPTFKSIPIFNQQVFTHPQFTNRKTRYDRYKVVQYADRWWKQPNPHYLTFEVDCTNFVSQCIYAGNAPMNYTGNRGNGWWYQGKKNGREWWSYSWAVAQSFQSFLSHSKHGLQAVEVESPWQLQIGDVINYAWNGIHFEHSTVVTAFDAIGMPLVNAHTNNSYHRYWDYRDSYAWSEATKYRFFHILDEFS